MIESINPATLEKNGEVEETSIEVIPELFKKARKAQKAWAKVPLAVRAKKVAGLTKYVHEHNEEICKIISQEVGKPEKEAYITEVYGVIDSTFTYFTNAEEDIGGEKEIPLGFYNSFGKKSILLQKPIGVIAVIGPFNYPFVIPMEDIVQGLMAGNAVIFKPSSDTVLVGQKIQDIFDQLQLPADLLQTVYGEGSKIGNLLVDEADKVFFTGSTATGKAIMRRAANTLTPVNLELGGKGAMVVLPDANLKRAALAARWGVFINSGQVCSSVKRLFVHESVYDQFVADLVELTKALKQGLPSEPNVDVGAMVNLEQLEIVDKMVQTGIKEGATVLIGGKRNPNLDGYFYEPTLMGNATNNMEIVQKEIFGPVLVILKFATEEEAIDLVNDNLYGLTSSVWTNDLEKGRAFAEQINTGSMMINEVVYTFALAPTPWGGTKHSGIGRSHGALGFHEMTRPLHINIDESEEEDDWWMPYDADYDEIVENFQMVGESLVVDPDDD